MYSGKIKSLPSILTSRVPISKKSRLVPIPEDTPIDIDESEQADVTETTSPTGGTDSGRSMREMTVSWKKVTLFTST